MEQDVDQAPVVDQGQAGGRVVVAVAEEGLLDGRDVPRGVTPAELAAQLKSELDTWGPIIMDAGIKPE